MMEGVVARLVGIGVVVALLAAAGFQINHWRNKAEKLDVVEKEYASYKADREAVDRTRRELAAAGVKDREELDAYRAKSNVRVVRVCNEPVQAPAGTGSGDLPPSPGSGPLREEIESDIGPGLYANVREADDLNLRFRKCQALVKKIYPEFADGSN